MGFLSSEGNVSLEEKYLIQMNTINTLKKDNVEMAAIIKKMEEEIYALKVMNNQYLQIYFEFFFFNETLMKNLF